MKNSFESLLGIKIPDMGEIGIIFFEECNLRCPMCPQDHTSIEGQSKDEILLKDSFTLSNKSPSGSRSLPFSSTFLCCGKSPEYPISRSFYN